MKFNKLHLLTLAVLSASFGASAATWTSNSPSGLPGNTVTYTISLQGDGATIDAQFDMNFVVGDFSAVANPVAVLAGSTCATAGNLVRVVTPPSGAPFSGTATALCSFDVTIAAGATIPSNLNFTAAMGYPECTSLAGAEPCTNSLSPVRVLAGPAAGPSITYTPATNAAVGTITFPAAASIGGTTPFDITTAIGATPGANGGETTVGSCVNSGNITFTDGAEICTQGGACVDGNLSLQCVATNAVQTGTVTCTETTDAEVVSGDNAVTTAPRTWGFTCPAAEVAPSLAYNLAPPGPINAPLVGQGQTANMSIAVTPSAGSGSITSTVSACTFGNFAGTATTFTAPAGTLTFSGSGTNAQNLTFSCVAPTNGLADATADLTCSETIGAGAATPRVWNVVCQDGQGVAAPTVDYNPPGPGALPTFAVGASIGSPTTQQVTVDIRDGLSGGGAAAESTSVTCSTASTGFSVGATGGPFSADAVAAIGVDGTVTVTCSAAATQQLGTLSCTATPSIDGVAQPVQVTDFALDCPAAAINVTANPAEGAIVLSGAPASELPGSIAITSTGSASTLTCTVGGSVTAVSPLVQPIPVGPNGSVSFNYTCLAGVAGVDNVGTISCTTGGTAPDDVLDYTLTCSGTSNAPIPAIGGLGKALLVSLMIGLGLLGLGARRQMI